MFPAEECKDRKDMCFEFQTPLLHAFSLHVQSVGRLSALVMALEEAKTSRVCVGVGGCTCVQQTTAHIHHARSAGSCLVSGQFGCRRRSSGW